uniref:Uncharacterized protein n=1 Tax=Alexandrium monilatum TaxID=311494 RepID=A0A7S4Q8M8_9DINO
MLGSARLCPALLFSVRLCPALSGSVRVHLSPPLPGDNMVDPTLRGILQSSVAKWNTDLYVANVTTLDPAVVQSVIDGISQKKYKYTTVTTHLVLKDQDLNDYNVTGLVKWGFWCRCLRCGPLAEASLSALRRWETL